jgi:hypothetical protein
MEAKGKNMASSPWQGACMHARLTGPVGTTPQQAPLSSGTYVSLRVTVPEVTACNGAVTSCSHSDGIPSSLHKGGGRRGSRRGSTPMPHNVFYVLVLALHLFPEGCWHCTALDVTTQDRGTYEITAMPLQSSLTTSWSITLTTSWDTPSQ